MWVRCLFVGCYYPIDSFCVFCGARRPPQVLIGVSLLTAMRAHALQKPSSSTDFDA